MKKRKHLFEDIQVGDLLLWNLLRDDVGIVVEKEKEVLTIHWARDGILKMRKAFMDDNEDYCIKIVNQPC